MARKNLVFFKNLKFLKAKNQRSIAKNSDASLKINTHLKHLKKYIIELSTNLIYIFNGLIHSFNYG
jgi:hypothetical protein